MKYSNLVSNIAKRSDVPDKMVRDVLFHLPDALSDLGDDDSVRTPMGSFRKNVTKSRTVSLPGGKGTATIPARKTIRLRPGKRLVETS